MIKSFLIALAILSNIFDRAAAQQPQQLTTNESFIDAVVRPSDLDIDDPIAVFSFVLMQLPERVHVYPTENYYYTSRMNF